MAGVNSLNIPLEIAAPTTGMVPAVLHELLDHLRLLAEKGTTHVIDLSGLPMSDHDREELKSRLGEGEINIELSALGRSRINETRYNGIWWISHYSGDGNLVAELIEIAAVPEIVRSHPDDIRQSIEELSRNIQTEHQEQHDE